jgi:hypothetical protein
MASLTYTKPASSAAVNGSSVGPGRVSIAPPTRVDPRDVIHVNAALARSY